MKFRWWWIALGLTAGVCILAFGLGLTSWAAPQSSPQANVLAYWGFDGSLDDGSGNAYPLNEVGSNLYFSAGCLGQALHFDLDPGSYLSRGTDDPAFDFGSGDYSVELWVNFDQVPSRSGEQTLIEKCGGGNCATSGWGLTVLGDNTVRFIQNNGSHQVLDSPPLPFEVGRWYHLVAVRNGASSYLYLNGAEVASGPAFDLLAPGNPLILGRRFDEAQQLPLVGFLDEVSIHDGALTAAEVLTRYQAGAACQALPVPLRIFAYDDYEESGYEGSLREYLEARGHTVTYTHDDVGDIDVWQEYAGYDAILAIHTVGSGTLTNLSTWFQNGRGYVAMLGGSMWNDNGDDYIRKLLGVNESGEVGEGWSPDQLSWADPGHPIADTPHDGWDLTRLPYGQDQFYVGIVDGHAVASGPGGPVLQVREGVEGAARLAVFGSNYHDTDRSDPEARYLVENLVTWVSDPQPAAWFDPASSLNRGFPGTTVSHTLELVNRTGQQATFDLSASGNGWPTSLDASVGPVPDNGRAQVIVAVQVPPTATTDEQDTVTIQAQATHNATLVATAELHTAAPGPAQHVELATGTYHLAASSSTVVTATVFDGNGLPVVDGTPVTFSAVAGGAPSPATVPTTNGQASTTFSAGPDCALAEIEAVSGDGWALTYLSVGGTGPIDVAGGQIAVDTTWAACDGPFLVHGDVEVGPGATLTVEAGTQVRFDGGTRLIVLGAIDAVGQSDARILFTANTNQPYSGFWTGLVLGNATNAASGQLDYVTLTYAGQYQAWGSAAPAPKIDYSPVQIQGEMLSLAQSETVSLGQSGGNYEAGLLIYRGAPTIQHSFFWRNQGHGLWAAYDSLPTLTDNRVLGNRGAGVRLEPAYLATDDTPIPSGELADVPWRTLAFEVPAAGWHTDPNFDEKGWSTELTPIGDGWNYKTYLDLEGDTLYARKIFTPTLPLTGDYYLRVSRDDEATVWINGALVLDDNQGGGAQWTQYIPVSLVSGPNLVAVEMRDSGSGANYFDLELASGTFQKPLISGNLIEGNDWSGIYVNHSAPLLAGNEIAHNGWGGVELAGYSWPEIRNNRIHHNGGNGIRLAYTYPGGWPSIYNNVLDSNGGSGIGWDNWWLDQPTIQNNIASRNGGEGIGCQETRTVDVSYNDVWGNRWNNDCGAGPGTISGDPFFVDPDGADYHLQLGSPAIDAGNPDPDYNDADASRNDMGAYGGPGGETYTYLDVRGPWVKWAMAEPGAVAPGEVVTLTAAIVDPSVVAWATAEIESPDETVITTLTLYDDGAHGDNLAGDDIWGTTWATPSGEQAYLVDVLSEDGLAQGSADDNVTGFRTHEPLTLTVTSTADSGPGTLRQALLDALYGDTITFDPVVFPPGSPATILVTSDQLPDLDDGHVTIDASNAGVILDGSGLPGNWEDGLGITASGNTILGLQITGFPGDGLEIQSGGNVVGGSTAAERNVLGGNGQNGLRLNGSGARDNVVQGNYFGVDASGLVARPNGENGIAIHDGASSNLIGGENASQGSLTAGNLIFANNSAGVGLWGSGTVENSIRGNWIGLNASGTARQAFPSDLAVSPTYASDCTLYVATLSTGVHQSTDCGDTWTEINNGLSEARLIQVEIPPDAVDDGRLYALADNGYLFVTTDSGANWSLVSTVLEGIDRRNLVLSADFGNDQTMYASAENWSWWELGDGPGVFKSTDGGLTWTRQVNGMSDERVSKVVASPDPAAKDTLFTLYRDVIQKSTDAGDSWTTLAAPDNNLTDLAVSPDYAIDQTVFVASENGRIYRSTDGGASWTGVDALRGDPRHLAFSPAYPTDQMVCYGGGWNDWIYCSTDGGLTWNQTNTWLPAPLNDGGTAIAFSPAYPADPTMFVLSFAGLSQSTDGGVTWNLVRSLRDLGNIQGVSIDQRASYNVVGPDNLISNNDLGVTISDINAAHNVVAGNLFGTDPSGTSLLGSPEHAVAIWGGHHNVIGGDTPEERNVINGSISAGAVWFHDPDVVSNTVSGNYIGLDASGAAIIGNANEGVALMQGASGNLIGGDSPGERNVISGNGWGVTLSSDGTGHNTVSGNYIGLDPTGTVALGNRSGGVGIWNGANDNVIGGETAGERNVISGNGDQGVGLWDSNTAYNIIQGNYIGTDASGAVALPNWNDGVHLNGTHDNQILDNLISGNRGSGTSLCCTSDTRDNVVQGNLVGTDASGTAALPNQGTGISLGGGASYNLIGGGDPGQGNVISGNEDQGIGLWDPETSYNVIQGNRVGTDASGMGALPNRNDGVHCNGPHHNTIGGTGAGEGNLISGNGGNGVGLWSGSTIFNVIEGNRIGTDITGVQPLRNGQQASAAAEPAAQPASQPPACTPAETAPAHALPDLAASEAGPEALPECGVVNQPAGRVIEPAADQQAMSNAGDGIVIADGASQNTVGIDNTIAFNAGSGIRIEGSDTVSNTITRNSLFQNDGAGIILAYGANRGLDAPRIQSLDLPGGQASGTACPGCTVEVFSADDEEGRIFEGSATAGGSGLWSLALGHPFTGPNVTATATDAAGNTSQFSPLFDLLVFDLNVGQTLDALHNLGISYTLVDAAQFATVNLADYDVLFVGFTGNDPQPDDLLQPLLDRRDDIAAFVVGGGGLVANSEDGVVATPLDWQWVPVTVTHRNTYANQMNIAQPAHLLAQGLSESLLAWWHPIHNFFEVWDWPEAEVVFTRPGTGEAVILAGSYGAGRMVLSGSDPDYHSGEQGTDRLLYNELYWAAGVLADAPPQVVDAVPQPGSETAGRAIIEASFDQLLDPATVDTSTVSVVGSLSGPVAGSVTYYSRTAGLVFEPATGLVSGEEVTVTLSAGIQDMSGLGLDGDGDGVAEGSPDDDYAWRFTVRAGQTLVVADPADGQPGAAQQAIGLTLRQALEQALPGDTITFDPAVFPPGNPTTIAPQGEPLPDLWQGYLTIDASTAGVILDGSDQNWGPILHLASDGNVVQGLQVLHAPNDGLVLDNGASLNLIGGGTLSTGASCSGACNLVSASGGHGIVLSGSDTRHNTIQGNYVGTDRSGTATMGNTYDGIAIWDASYSLVDHNLLGGNCASQSGCDGLGIHGTGAVYSVVTANYIGVDINGLNPLRNEGSGITIADGASHNRVGGWSPNDRNIIGANQGGIEIVHPHTTGNAVLGNYIGTDATGIGALGHDWDGISVSGSSATQIEGNVVANNGWGVWLRGVRDSIIRNNWIGVNAAGDPAGNREEGLSIVGYPSSEGDMNSYDNRVEGNVIAHNAQGVLIYESGGMRVEGNTLTHNSIYGSQGLSWMYGLEDGIALMGDANHNLVPPLVTASDPGAGTANGTACAGCTVEIYSDDDDEGRWFEGSISAGGLGDWTFSKGGPFTGVNVHATATDGDGNTSEFSGPPPIVSSVSPTGTVAGTADLGVIVSGDGFRDNEPLVADFGDGISVTGVEYQGRTQIRVYLDVDPGASLGPRNVTVTNYDGQSHTLPAGFEVVPVPPPPPMVTGMVPDEISPGVTGDLWVEGTDFIDRPQVALSGDGITVNSVTFEEATRLRINVTVDPSASLGPRDVTVTNPDGQGHALAGVLTVVEPLFVDVAPALGLDVSSGEHGAAWGDLDGDGWLDLVLGNGSLFTSSLGTAFHDASGAAALDPVDLWGGVAWGDYDNDGDPDLLSSWAKIYRQDSLPFSKVFDGGSHGPSLSWADYDLDADLDAYASGRLYRNEGGDNFADVTAAAGLGGVSMPQSSAWADYDGDGDPDLYLACSGCANRLYRNNGDGTFANVTESAGVGDEGSGHGVAWGDYDNDGDLDLFVANNDYQYSVLYRNEGNGTFADVSGAAGLHDRYGYATGCNWLDYDLDGRLDLFVVNRDDRNRLYRNRGDGTFADYGLSTGLIDDRDSDGSTVGDYDNDGDPDIYVVSGIGGSGTPNMLFQNGLNPGGGGPHWLKVRLVGTLSNASAIGARVRVYGGGPLQTRQLAGASGYLSQDAPEALFGLGNYGGTIGVEVAWPSGVVDTRANVAVDQVLTVVESTPYLHNMAVVNVAPDGEWPIEIPFQPVVTLRNLGQRAESGVPVSCRVDQDGSQVYLQTRNTGSVSPGAWTTLVFPAYAPASTGPHTLTCRSDLPGDADPADDELASELMVTQQIADAWTKDNPADDGDVPSGVNNWYGSPDLWVRHQPDGGLVHQDPIAGVENTVYVRIRNRGNTPVYEGTVSVSWIEPSLGVRCGDWAPIADIPFTNLLPGEVRIISTPWVPTRTGHTCLQDVIDSPQDPYNRGLECAPQWVPWDNNVEWRNVNVYDNPGGAHAGMLDVKEAEVQLVNVYERAQDVDMIVERKTFPLSGNILVKMPEALFDRWLAYGHRWGEGIEVLPATKEIHVTGEISATVGAVPMQAGEQVTVGLRFEGPAGLEFELAIRERIAGITTGGVGYQWVIPDTTPPDVLHTVPADDASDVDPGSPLVITFNEPVGPLTLDLVVSPDPGGWSLAWNEAGTVVTATHADLALKTLYNAAVSAGDASGNVMSAPYTWSFMTMDQAKFKIYLPLVVR